MSMTSCQRVPMSKCEGRASAKPERITPCSALAPMGRLRLPTSTTSVVELGIHPLEEVVRSSAEFRVHSMKLVIIVRAVE